MWRNFGKNSSFKRACLVVVHLVRRRLSVVDCVLCDHPWILWWLCKPSLEAQSLQEQVGHWSSVAVMSAENALGLRYGLANACQVWNGGRASESSPSV